MTAIVFRAVWLLVVATAPACGIQAPRPIISGADACDFCRMTVSDTRFAAELQSKTGKIHVFDAIECLASYYMDAVARGDVRGVWVTDFASGRLVPADSAVFLAGSTVKSPMGRSLVAFAPSAGAPAALEAEYGGHALTWGAVLDRMREQRLVPGADSPVPTDTAVERGAQTHLHGTGG